MLILAGLVVALDVAVWKLAPASQPPIPSARDANREPDHKASAKETKSDPTAESDSLAIHIVKSEQESRQERQDKQDEAADRGRALVVNGILAVITFLTGVAVAWQAKETRRTANAAISSLRLASLPFIDLKRIEVIDNNKESPAPPLLTLNCKLFNASSNTARVTKIEARCRVGLREASITNALNHAAVAIVPQRGHWYPITLTSPLDPFALDSYNHRQLTIDLLLKATFNGPLESGLSEEFVRTLTCGPDGFVKVYHSVSNPFLDPQERMRQIEQQANQGQPKDQPSYGNAGLSRP